MLKFPAEKFALAVAQNLERDDEGAIIFRLYVLVLNEMFTADAALLRLDWR
jgi:hypothetical protein